MPCDIVIHGYSCIQKQKKYILILGCKIKSFYFNWLCCCSAPSETAMSEHGNEDAGVVQQDMVTQANTVPLSQNVL